MTRAASLASLVREAAQRIRSCKMHNVRSCVMCQQLKESRLSMLGDLRALLEAVPGGGWR